MVRTALACTLALLSLPTVAFAEGTNGGPGWEYVKTDRDVEVYRKEVPGSGVVAFKGVTTANLPRFYPAADAFIVGTPVSYTHLTLPTNREV